MSSFHYFFRVLGGSVGADSGHMRLTSCIVVFTLLFANYLSLNGIMYNQGQYLQHD